MYTLRIGITEYNEGSYMNIDKDIEVSTKEEARKLIELFKKLHIGSLMTFTLGERI